MKRSAALVQLSRDHHHALKLAVAVRRLDDAADDQQIRDIIDEVVRTMASELEPHFQQEENGLLPALAAFDDCGPLLARTLDDHR
ncbi:MAG TPA: hemerythrin domain-containing protein, partial [Accumulibacter sp.]|nr:hemerythrin domain-containing protein [Accumulibacter sp.]